MNTSKNIVKAMKMRAHVARIACPAAIIDTDNWPVKNLASWRRYLKLQPDLGVPSLYFATHIDATKEPLDDEDYQLIQEIWSRHRENLKKPGKNAKPAARSKGSQPPRWVNDLRRRYAFAVARR
jgi:hypothetical protein